MTVFKNYFELERISSMDNIAVAAAAIGISNVLFVISYFFSECLLVCLS